MKRKVLGIGAVVLILSLVLVATVGAVGTGAWFTDTATSGNNIITAGTLDLTVDGSNDAILPAEISATKLAPGAWDNLGHATLTNIGNLPGQLSFKVKNIANTENGITAPETAAGDVTAVLGELGPKISLSIQENAAPWTRYTAMSSFADGAVLSTQGRILQPGESIQVVFYVTWAQTSDDNLAQGDSVTFDLEINLAQIH